MPPKPKFKKEEIVNAALEIISKNGLSNLTARELGKVLNSSPRPIFTMFENMEELINETRIAGMKKFEAFDQNIPQDMPYFKQTGMKMVMFALYEPKLYQFLFMEENKNNDSFDSLFNYLGDMAAKSVEHICENYNLSNSSAKLLFENMWIYTYGIGTLCATKTCKFKEEQLSDLLSTEFQALLKHINNLN